MPGYFFTGNFGLDLKSVLVLLSFLSYCPVNTTSIISPRIAEILLEKAKREKEEEIKRLIKAIKARSLEIEAIEEELKNLEEEKKSLERQIEELNIYIRREESKRIDIDIVLREHIKNLIRSSQIYPQKRNTNFFNSLSRNWWSLRIGSRSVSMKSQN